MILSKKTTSCQDIECETPKLCKVSTRPPWRLCREVEAWKLCSKTFLWKIQITDQYSIYNSLLATTLNNKHQHQQSKQNEKQQQQDYFTTSISTDDITLVLPPSWFPDLCRPVSVTKIQTSAKDAQSRCLQNGRRRCLPNYRISEWSTKKSLWTYTRLFKKGVCCVDLNYQRHPPKKSNCPTNMKVFQKIWENSEVPNCETSPKLCQQSNAMSV